MMDSDAILSVVVMVVGLFCVYGLQETKRSCGMSENPFKVGDTVVCIDPNPGAGLEMGSEWVVKARSGGYLYFDEKMDNGWRSDRFKLKDPDAPEFKPGDEVVCVHAGCAPFLRERDVYVVESCDQVQVRVAGVKAGLDPSRFKLKEPVPVIPEFNPGDEVQCIRDKGMEHEITKGRVYRVRDCGDRHVHLEGVVPWVFKDRVQLIPAEFPEDWVEITDPNHVLRECVDEIRYSKTQSWEVVSVARGYSIAQLRQGVYDSFRCRRKDHPDFQVRVPEPATNVHCGGPYVAVSEHSRVCVELANERASSGQVIQQLKDDLTVLTKDHTALEKQRDQLQSELALARAGGMSCCAPEWTPMEWTPLQRAEQPSQQSQLDRWAEVALPGVIMSLCWRDRGTDIPLYEMSTIAYQVAERMVAHQKEMRQRK